MTSSTKQPRPQPLKGVLLSKDLVAAKLYSDAAYLTAHHSLACHSPLHPSDEVKEIRFSLRSLQNEQSQGIHEINLLGSHIGIELSPSIKAAAN